MATFNPFSDLSLIEVDWKQRLNDSPSYVQTEKCYKDIASIFKRISDCALAAFLIIGYLFGVYANISLLYPPLITYIPLLPPFLLLGAALGIALVASEVSRLFNSAKNFWNDPIYCEREGRAALSYLDRHIYAFNGFEERFKHLFARGILRPEDVEISKIHYFAISSLANAESFIQKNGLNAFKSLIANQKDVCKKTFLGLLPKFSHQTWVYWYHQNEQLCLAYGWERQEFLSEVARMEVEMETPYPTLIRRNAEEHLVGMEDAIMELEVRHIQNSLHFAVEMPLVNRTWICKRTDLL